MSGTNNPRSNDDQSGAGTSRSSPPSAPVDAGTSPNQTSDGQRDQVSRSTSGPRTVDASTSPGPATTSPETLSPSDTLLQVSTTSPPVHPRDSEPRIPRVTSTMNASDRARARYSDFFINEELSNDIRRLTDADLPPITLDVSTVPRTSGWAAPKYGINSRFVDVYNDPWDRLKETNKSQNRIRTIRSSSTIGKKAKFREMANARDAKYYDFLMARTPGPRTTVFESVGHLIKSCLGGGIMTMHEAYKEVGIWTAVVLNVVLGFAVTYLMHMLTKTAHKAYGRTQTPVMSFSDLAEACVDISPFLCLRKYSKCMRYAVDVTIMIDLFGSCCCYQVMVAKQASGLLGHFVEGLQYDLRIVIASLLIPCLLLCWILSLKYLAPASIIADMILVLVTVTTVYFSIQSAPTPLVEMVPFKSVTGMFIFLGVTVFSMEGIGMVLPIENHMKNPRKIGMVIWIAMAFVVSLVMITGFFGYYGFGEATRSPITLNFPYSNKWSIFLKFGLTLTIYVTFAVNFWVPFNLAWVYIKRIHKPNHINWWERLYRSIFVVFITMVAVIFPNVEKFMAVIGAFCLSNMGFIYPAFFELLIDWNDPGLGTCKWRLWKFFAIFTFGIVLMIVGTTSNMILLIKAVF